MLCGVGSSSFGSGYYLQVVGGLIADCHFYFYSPAMGTHRLYIAFVLLSIARTPTEGGQAQWCVADPQAPADILQGALDWACGPGRADCNAIQWNNPCFLPNTLAAHASYAFNTYWQNYKHKGASCHFNAAAFITESNPSHDGCQFVFIQ